jgi:hypothetical protein
MDKKLNAVGAELKQFSVDLHNMTEVLVTLLRLG